MDFKYLVDIKILLINYLFLLFIKKNTLREKRLNGGLMMRLVLLLLILFIQVTGFSVQQTDYLEKLKEGNARFVQQGYAHKELASAQFPFCAVLACADSRVAPELVFDQNLGDLFVVRIAGNVATKGIIESLDFACKVLKVNLIVVMGHQNCGAVDAVRNGKASIELGSIYSLIYPLVEKTHSLKEAVIANVREQINLIKGDPLLQKEFLDRSLRIVGAYYNFETGLVDFFE
jgi:carbonic anhydrase